MTANGQRPAAAPITERRCFDGVARRPLAAGRMAPGRRPTYLNVPGLNS